MSSATINPKLLAWYQITGGIIGICVWVISLIQTESISGIILFMLLAMISLYIFSIQAGRTLLQDRKKGLKLSLINQALQTIHFAVAGYSLQFVSGVGVTIGLDLTKDPSLKFNFLISTLVLSINYEKHIATLTFNIIAIYLIFYITRLQNKATTLSLDYTA